MNIPSLVKIGGFIYDVERPKGSFVGDSGTALDGEHCFSQKSIKVGTNGCAEYQQVVFLHEICHAIIDCYVSDEKQDENFVEQFSKGLYQVVVDNPEIFKNTSN